MSVCFVLRSVHITAKDAQSGLKSITISIYDTTLRVVVWTETRPALTLQPLVNSTRKRVNNVLLLFLLFLYP